MSAPFLCRAVTVALLVIIVDLCEHSGPEAVDASGMSD